MSTGSPQAWPSRDCSLQYCSIYCPQWCYFYFRPPPPASTSPSFALSPLLVAIIVILSCAFFAVAAYLAASKNCYSRRPAASAAAAATPAVARRPNPSAGLDDSVIGKLTTYRYRSAADRDGDCSVCLGEFRDGESVRLLPKCCHAFHQSCIDMWLKSHSSCPLCRAGVVEVVVPVAEETGTAAGAVVLGRGSEGERREEEEEVAIEIGEEGGQGGEETAETAESSAGRRALISV